MRKAIIIPNPTKIRPTNDVLIEKEPKLNSEILPLSPLNKKKKPPKIHTIDITKDNIILRCSPKIPDLLIWSDAFSE